MSEEKQVWLFKVDGDNWKKLGWTMTENTHEAVENNEEADIGVPDEAMKGERPEGMKE